MKGCLSWKWLIINLHVPISISQMVTLESGVVFDFFFFFGSFSLVKVDENIKRLGGFKLFWLVNVQIYNQRNSPCTSRKSTSDGVRFGMVLMFGQAFKLKLPEEKTKIIFTAFRGTQLRKQQRDLWLCWLTGADGTCGATWPSEMLRALFLVTCREDKVKCKKKIKVKALVVRKIVVDRKNVSRELVLFLM